MSNLTDEALRKTWIKATTGSFVDQETWMLMGCRAIAVAAVERERRDVIQKMVLLHSEISDLIAAIGGCADMAHIERRLEYLLGMIKNHNEDRPTMLIPRGWKVEECDRFSIRVLQLNGFCAVVDERFNPVVHRFLRDTLNANKEHKP